MAFLRFYKLSMEGRIDPDDGIDKLDINKFVQKSRLRGRSYLE